MSDPAAPPEPEQLRFSSSGLVPNHPALPVLVSRGALHRIGVADARAVIARFAANGWVGAWVDGIYPFHHYHARSHEVLAITGGRVRVMLGGPDGTRLTLAAGDVVVLPAGTGHRRIEATADLEVVGAYPAGQEDWDLKRETPADLAAARAEIPAVADPDTDPLHGPDGPLVRIWRAGHGAG